MLFANITAEESVIWLSLIACLVPIMQVIQTIVLARMKAQNDVLVKNAKTADVKATRTLRLAKRAAVKVAEVKKATQETTRDVAEKVHEVKVVAEETAATLVTVLENANGSPLELANTQIQLKHAHSDRDSYREMAEDAITNLEKVIDTHPEAASPKLPPLAPVIPEHSSPTTKAQQAAADIQTLRARLVAATLAIGLPARVASEPATAEEEKEELAP